ncbi:MAG: hypothetical protein K0V04_33155 [Deltaproteobacteria bacterium]|nr:hypothetical protein [Deltaproteobacteria bacterium]
MHDMLANPARARRRAHPFVPSAAVLGALLILVLPGCALFGPLRPSEPSTAASSTAASSTKYETASYQQEPTESVAATPALNEPLIGHWRALAPPEQRPMVELARLVLADEPDLAKVAALSPDNAKRYRDLRALRERNPRDPHIEKIRANLESFDSMTMSFTATSLITSSGGKTSRDDYEVKEAFGDSLLLAINDDGLSNLYTVRMVGKDELTFDVGNGTPVTMVRVGTPDPVMPSADDNAPPASPKMAGSRGVCGQGWSSINQDACARVDRMKSSYGSTSVLGQISFLRASYRHVLVDVSLYQQGRLVVTCPAVLSNIEKGEQVAFEALCAGANPVHDEVRVRVGSAYPPPEWK